MDLDLQRAVSSGRSARLNHEGLAKMVLPTSPLMGNAPQFEYPKQGESRHLWGAPRG